MRRQSAASASSSSATRGQAGPGEVLVKIRGGSEAYLAWSDKPLKKGETVLVIDSRGARAVDVIEWAGPLDVTGSDANDSI